MRAVVIVAAFLAAACTSSSVANDYVPWLPLSRGNQYPLPPSPSPPVAIPFDTPFCPAAQLEGALLGSFATASGADTPVVLRNTGSTPCYVNGVPDLTIVDSQGQVLASVRGAGGTGTQYDSGISAVDVLMPAGTPPLSDSMGTSASENLTPGLTFVHIRWTGCAHEPASKLYLDLPRGAGRVIVAFAVAAPDPNGCSQGSPLVRDPLKPTGVVWPPPPDFLKGEYSLDMPASVARGATFTYFVTVHNASDHDYVLTPCPDYTEALIPDGTTVNYQLNCEPVGAIRAGRSIKFEMKLPDWSFDVALGSRRLAGQPNLHVEADRDQLEGPSHLTAGSHSRRRFS